MRDPNSCPSARNRARAAIIVPTLNEVGNVRRLVEALDAALVGWDAEIIFVDDWSTDGTPDLVTAIAQTRPDVRLIRRFGRRGLASAVIEGVLSTSAEIFAVIDADMQHDERILPRLLAMVADGAADVAVGSRYGDGGSIGDWDPARARVSGLATTLAQRALQLTRRGDSCGGVVTDPMSGFFAARRQTLVDALPAMSGQGFKILLDLLMSSPRALKVEEEPFVFRGRLAGESKLGAAVCLQYLTFLATRVAGRLIPARLLGFGAVGLAGLAVQLLLMRTLQVQLHLLFGTAQALAVMAAIAFNFFCNNALTYRDRRLTGAQLLPGLASFYVVCGLGAVGNVAVAWLVYMTTRQPVLAGVVGAVTGSAWNFGASRARTWRTS